MKKIFSGYSTIDRKISKTSIYDKDLVKRDLLNHIFTRRGERVMNPTFGTSIHDLLFEPFNESLKDRIISEIREVIDAEPRVQLAGIETFEEDWGLTIKVDLYYNIFEDVETLYLEFKKNFSTTDPEKNLDNF
jgi:phage baseplate assembly protein W